MKIFSCRSLLAFALWHVVFCTGVRVGVSKQQEEDLSNELALYKEKTRIRDDTKSIVEGDAFTEGRRAMKECGQNQKVFFVTFTTDNYGDETSFQIIGPSGGIIGRAPLDGQKFQDNTQYTYHYCVKIGLQHRLRWDDSGADGMCCKHGKGTYRYGIDGVEMYGSDMQQTFTTVGVHVFRVPAESSSSSSGGLGGSGGSGGSGGNGSSGSSGSSGNNGGTISGKNDDDGLERDEAWLEAHNVRRKKYHEQWGKSYVPLKWSPMLANEARQWANQLLNDCDIPGVKHEPGISEGENMAKNIGSGANGELKTPDQILNRFVEMEMDDGYPQNAHLTQALWRASKYVGCADSVKAIDGGYCRYQVCRYATAGNCNMGYYNAATGNNWMTPMLNDESKCGPDCTPEGWC